ncbi:predicted protein [Arabidopsis lyrata subsp. lyrata]|uniref:Predicted protein n=1 Tax=Arabidopsis lyrata subsp. lyrata TaxID=81972 RepID=D7MUT1_ARALL|nr:predicted protein [Arabidopsis lyrata subsp. lyrata]
MEVHVSGSLSKLSGSLFHLTWLDLKYSTSLTLVPELPPNLPYLDAQGCSSLKTVAKPVPRIMPTVQSHCTLNFTNCDNLEQAALDEITSFGQSKCQFLSDVRKHYNEGFSSGALFTTRFPGCEPKSISSFSVACTFTIKVQEKSWIPFTCQVGSWEGDKEDKIESDHVFIAYITCPHTIRCLEDENSDKCNFTEASLEFNVTGGTSQIGTFTVLRCGLSLVYAKDKNKNSSHEAKYDMPVEVSFQEPQQGMKEEQRKLKKQEFMIDDQRRSEKPEVLFTGFPVKLQSRKLSNCSTDLNSQRESVIEEISVSKDASTCNISLNSPQLADLIAKLMFRKENSTPPVLHCSVEAPSSSGNGGSSGSRVRLQVPKQETEPFVNPSAYGWF